MTPKQRAIAAFEQRIPDHVPTFELEFQLTQALFGQDYLTQRELDAAPSADARERLLQENADLFARVAERLEYDIVPLQAIWREAHQVRMVHLLRERVGDTRMICAHGDSTMGIPDGEHMVEVSIRLAEEADAVHAEQRRNLAAMLEHCTVLVDAGVDVFINCADYCFNHGPFLSPPMFAEFVTPYLTALHAGQRALGAYTIKHTDGNIMPILDQLAASAPHALHSIDPMAGVDIAVVKRQIGDRVALCGNVNCALMQTGTDEDVIASARYCLTHAKPGGGYFFCTSNVPFNGLPLERYLLILDVWKEMRAY
ncbi:MAG TPA: uroporphyrinogen decarboxylase family protein [Armatimonadota bacterium]|nr:uroporphyrinogen decarboxylase family protein [Armatimonadota bacterium]